MSDILQMTMDFKPTASAYDREGWCYVGRATAAERERQAAWQTVLNAHERRSTTCAPDVFLSELSTYGAAETIIGTNSFIGSECQIAVHGSIGENVSINAGCVVRGKIDIGDGVRIATGSQILGFNHGHADTSKPIYQQPHTRKGIRIEDDVWIGANAIILDGVTIGAHSIVAAGAVVTKSMREYSIIGGNPAKIIKDRRAPETQKNNAQDWLDFTDRVRDEMPSLLRTALDPEGGEPRDVPGQQARTRPWCDWIELAAMTDVPLPQYSKAELIDRLQSFQDPETGLVRGPYGEGNDWQQEGEICWRYLEDRHAAYMVMAVGYALECLDSHLAHPVHVAANLRHADLHQHLDKLTWVDGAWGAGAWVDHYASALAFNAKYHGQATDCSDLFGWLNTHAHPATGMWGAWRQQDGWLMPVKGFYRLTRGSYAQWGVPLPYPERSIDTTLAHCTDQRMMVDGKANACFILDIIHPLWLCLKQTDHRRAEAEHYARYWLQHTMNRWVSEQGIAFHTAGDSEPNLQGTEMWLSIAWLCADILGWNPRFGGLIPKGVHRPDPIVSAIQPVA